MQGVRLHGIYGRRIYDTWERTQALLAPGARRHADHHPPAALADWEQAFDLIASRHAGKVVLVP